MAVLTDMIYYDWVHVVKGFGGILTQRHAHPHGCQTVCKNMPRTLNVN